MNNTIKVAWMYPDVLNLHGERANAKAFELIAKKLKIKLEIDRIDNIDQIVDFDEYDILLFNAGELKNIEIIKESLLRQKNDLDKYIKDNKIIFVTGTTGALFADQVNRTNGNTFEGLNILNMDVNERKMVIGDDIYFKANNMEILGSQIQMIDIDLKNVKPYGKIRYGYGNKGSEDEGARFKNVIFTNTLGPVLVKNPWLTEYLIFEACKNKSMKIKKEKIKFDLELKSKESMKEFLKKKMTTK